MSESIPGYDAWKLTSPPYLEPYPEELCEHCHRDLDDTAVHVIGKFFCWDCATIDDRCDQCGRIDCRCEP